MYIFIAQRENTGGVGIKEERAVSRGQTATTTDEINHVSNLLPLIQCVNLSLMYRRWEEKFGGSDGIRTLDARFTKEQSMKNWRLSEFLLRACHCPLLKLQESGHIITKVEKKEY